MEKSRVSKQRITYLIIIMAVVSSVVAFSSIGILYNVSFEQQRLRLLEVAQSRARIIESVAKFDAKDHIHDSPGGPFQATLSQITEAHKNFRGFGETGEFTLAELKDNHIFFLLQHRHNYTVSGPGKNESFKLGLKLAEPMQKVLQGEVGSMVGFDYRGEKVLAAYEPVEWSGRNVGIVAKIDLSEIREPFINASLFTAIIALFAIVLGTVVFKKISNPLINNLEESEGHLIEAQQTAHMGSWNWDIKSGLTSWSDEMFNIYGISKIAPMSYERWASMVYPDDLPKAEASLQRVIETRKQGQVEFKIIRPDGSLRYIDATIKAITDDENKTIKVIGANIDITARKRAEMALLESEVQFRLIFNNVPAMIAQLDSGKHYRLINQPYAEHFGLNAEDSIGLHLSQVMGEKAYAFVRPYIEEVLAGQNVYYEICPPDKTGTPQWLSVSYVPDRDDSGKVIGFYALIINIQVRKKSEEALSKSEKLYHSLVEAINEGMAMVDENGIFTYANQQYCKMLGYSITEIMGVRWMSIFDEDAQEVIKEQLKKRSKGSTEHYELENTRKDGKKIWLHISPTPIYDDDGNVKGSMGLVQDITGRKFAEDALRGSEKRLNEAQAIAHSGSWDWDLNSNEVIWSDEQYRLFGLEPGEIQITNIVFQNALHKEDRDNVTNAINRALSGEPDYDAEFRIARKDGKERVIKAHGLVERDASGTPIRMVGTNIDITERKKAEEEAKTRAVELEESHRHLRELYQHLDHVREEEKASIAREIHDELGMTLTAIALGTGWLAQHFRNGNYDQSVINKLDEIALLLEDATGTSRNIMSSLHPSILDTLGLIETIEWQANEFEKRFDMACSVKAKELTFRMKDNAAIALFRTLQESLTNIMKHAGATHVQISLDYDSQWLTLQVEDNGVGLEEDALSKADTHGVRGMKERAFSLGGELLLGEGSEGGARVIVRLPLNAIREEGNVWQVPDAGDAGVGPKQPGRHPGRT